jgi:hypothetical protein
MIITSHMQKIIQIHPCLLKVSCKQESVTDGQTDRQTDRRTAAITISPTAIAGDNKSYKAQISEALGISYMHKAT